MSIGITDLIAGVFKPAADLIDNLHTSEAERLEARGHLMSVQASVLQLALNYELASLQARAGIVAAEAKSESVLARNWRPITMLTFLFLIVAKSFGWINPDLEFDRLWTLMEYGLGGYVVGRSLEKVTKTVVQSRSMDKMAKQ